MKISHKLFTIACLASISFAGVALAQEEEAPAAVQAFLDNIEAQSGAEVDYEAVKEDGDGNVTLTGLTVTKAAKGDEPGLTLKIGQSEFNDISEESDTLYKVGNAKFANTTVDVTGKDFAFNMSMPESSAEEWFIHESAENPTPEQAMMSATALARKMSAGKMIFTAMGQTVTADGLETTWDGDPNTLAGTYTMKVTNIAIPEAVVSMMDPSGMLKQLGYTSLSFDVSGDGTTTRTGDNFTYAVNSTIAGRDMAAIKLGVSAGDIPLAVFAELQKAQSAGTEPDFTALMPQIQNIVFNGASLRLEDASLTRKLLPMLAAMRGMDEKTLVASIGPMMQMGLMQLQNEAFASQASAAVNAFLADPKSLTVSANPAAPVKVSDFMAMNPNAPGEAISKLGVTVSAND